MSLLRVDEVSLQLFLKSSYLVGVFWRTGCNTFLGPRTPPEFFRCFPCMCTFLRPWTPTEVFCLFFRVLSHFLPLPYVLTPFFLPVCPVPCIVAFLSTAIFW